MTAQQIVDQTRDLAVVSPAALKLVSLLNQPNANSSEVLAAVRCDAALSARMLRICNSSMYATSEPIASVEHALLHLGYRGTYRVVLTLTFGGTLGRPVPAYAMTSDELWRHSMLTALAAEVLATRVPALAEHVTVAYTAGLLHDIGKIVLTPVFTPARRDEVLRLVSEKALTPVAAEREVLGTEHAEAGACLLSSWRLPARIVEAVAQHHTPVSSVKPSLAAVVQTANVLAHCHDPALTWEQFTAQAGAVACDACDLRANNFGPVLEQLAEGVKKVEEYAAAAAGSSSVASTR